MKQGDNWNHVALDPEHCLVVSVEPGKRTAENVETASKHINTAFVERQNGTDRNRNGRKVRKT